MIVMTFDDPGAVTNGTSVYGSWPSGSRGYVLPLVGVVLALGVPGTVSGSTIADVNQATAGACLQGYLELCKMRDTSVRGM